MPKANAYVGKKARDDDDDDSPEKDGKFEDSSEEDEDEDQDRYEEDGFLVDDEVEEDGDDDSPRPFVRRDDEETRRKKSKKRKKRRHREDPDLAEADLELLKDSGVRVDTRKRLKRLRKDASDEEPEDDLGDDDRLLSRDEEEERFQERRRRADDPIDYDDDMDDFLDDGGRSSRRRAAERDGLVSSEAVRTARSIFGDIDEVDNYKGTSLPLTQPDGDDDDADEDYVAKGEKPALGRSSRSRIDADSDLSDPEADGDRRTGRDASQRAEEDGAIAEGLSSESNEEEAKRITGKDIPEQLQLHFGPAYITPTEAEIQDEASWIYRKGFCRNDRFVDNNALSDMNLVTEKIVIMLSYLHIDKCDIPFIAMYLKDDIAPLLYGVGEVFREEVDEAKSRDVRPMIPPRGFNSVVFEDYIPELSYEHERGIPRGYDDGFCDWALLWYILDLDKKYAEMTQRKTALLRAVDEAEAKGVPAFVRDDVRTMAHSCDEERELKDGEKYLRLAMELADAVNKDRIDDFDDDADRKSRRPSRRKNRYTEFCKRGYRPLTKDLGLGARSFGENLKGAIEYGVGGQVHAPIETDTDPLETARLVALRTGDYSQSTLDEKVMTRILTAARFILVTEITSDLAVLQATRQSLRKEGVVIISTDPTPQGIDQVDDTHPLRCVTYLSEKRFESFKNTVDYALICRAVELGFTKMSINFRYEEKTAFEKHLESSILVQHASSDIVKLWNVERRLVVEEVKKILFKTMINEVREELEEMTASVLRVKLTNAASRRFLLGPTRVRSRDNGSPRVLAFCVTTEDDEDDDPAQKFRDERDSTNRRESSSHRVAYERITIVDLDENGEYCNGYEMFASWLRRPMRVVDLPKDVKEQLQTYILRSKAQVIVVGIGSGQRTPIRLRNDLINVLHEMILSSGKKDEDERVVLPSFLSHDDVHYSKTAKIGDGEIQNRLSRHFRYCDDFPCRIYAKSKAANTGLSVDGMTLLEKRAIALGRMAQEPLWVYSSIGQERELAVRLQFHQYHFYAKPADRATALNRALTRAVCSVGVDVNRMVRLPHLQSVLPFVAGLGLLKAKDFLKKLDALIAKDEEVQLLRSRSEIRRMKLVGPLVFKSASSFLRVRDPDLHPGGSTYQARELRRQLLNRTRQRRRDGSYDDDVFDPQDDTRIPHEHHGVAVKIADEALRDDLGRPRIEITPEDERNGSVRTTSAVMEDPEGLKRLDLDQYALQLESIGRGSLRETVKLIASEFEAPFFDYRVGLTSPENRALFYIVSGADPILFRIGSAVTALNCIVRQKRRQSAEDHSKIAGISCSLPNGIRGFIPLKDFSDNTLDDADIYTLVPNDSALQCRVIGFNYDNFEATLSSKISLMKDPSLVSGYVSMVDKTDVSFRPYPSLHSGSANLANASAEKQLLRRDAQRKSTFERLNSFVDHESFKNLSGEQAIDILRNGLPGDVIIRPSQYNQNEIIFSSKFANLDEMHHNRSILHIPCRVVNDEGNEGEGILPSLKYKIDGNVYEQVDQVLEEYVRPIITNLSEAIDNRKFKQGSLEELQKMIGKEKHTNPMCIPYCFGLSERRAARLIMVFIPGSKTVFTEEIFVVPSGYRFRSTLHIHIEKLITWFKQNMRKGGPRRPDGVAGRDGASSLSTHQSPFKVAASPFHAPASPFHGAAVQAPPLVPPSIVPPVMAARAVATPVKDIAPPAAPLAARASAPGAIPGAAAALPSAPNSVPAPPPVVPNAVPHPYAYGPPSGMARGPMNGMGPRRGEEMDWSRATKHVDEPPPMMGNGGGMDNRRPPGPPPPGPPPPGPPPMGPPPRGFGGAGSARPHPPGAHMGDGRPPVRREGGLPSWRGQKPVPAWKAQQESRGG